MGLRLCSKSRATHNQIGVDSPDVRIYHEKQVLELCALHAMNNLLQDKNAFDAKELNRICQVLTPSLFFNPHRSVFGTGNYDVNVIMAALQSKGYEVLWFDKRRSVHDLSLGSIEGFILNKPSEYKIADLLPFGFNRKHWIAIRNIGDSYYNLDSKLKYPELIGDEQSVLDYLEGQVFQKDSELLFVVTSGTQSPWKSKV